MLTFERILSLSIDKSTINAGITPSYQAGFKLIEEMLDDLLPLTVSEMLQYQIDSFFELLTEMNSKKEILIDQDDLTNPILIYDFPQFQIHFLTKDEITTEQQLHELLLAAGFRNLLTPFLYAEFDTTYCVINHNKNYKKIKGIRISVKMDNHFQVQYHLKTLDNLKIEEMIGNVKLVHKAQNHFRNNPRIPYEWILRAALTLKNNFEAGMEILELSGYPFWTNPEFRYWHGKPVIRGWR